MEQPELKEPLQTACASGDPSTPASAARPATSSLAPQACPCSKYPSAQSVVPLGHQLRPKHEYAGTPIPSKAYMCLRKRNRFLFVPASTIVQAIEQGMVPSDSLPRLRGLALGLGAPRAVLSRGRPGHLKSHR